MLRKHMACHEISNRVREVLPEFLPSDEKEVQPRHSTKDDHRRRDHRTGHHDRPRAVGGRCPVSDPSEKTTSYQAAVATAQDASGEIYYSVTPQTMPEAQDSLLL
jgi:hypothetical protein